VTRSEENNFSSSTDGGNHSNRSSLHARSMRISKVEADGMIGDGMIVDGELAAAQ
jgi:hypothetical protein